jgi:FAD-dependent urate hydroxylase
MFGNDVVVIGAGPYGLSAAAHLRAAGVAVRVFGEVMEFWERQMPVGMLVRSEWDGSHFSDPARAFTLGAYERATGQRLPERIPLAEFVRYGQWFQRQAVPDVEPRRVVQVEPRGAGFAVRLDDGEATTARRVVVATGLAGFASRPEVFAPLPPSLVSHASEESDLSRFAGQRVAVVGAGQSALESAALLVEGGAEVEVLTRRPVVHWLGQGHNTRESGRLAHLVYPPGAVGPLGVNWIVQLPSLYRALPRTLQDRVAVRALRPAGSGWLRPRLSGVPITTGVGVLGARPVSGGVGLTLSDGTTREVGHVLLGVGYRIDVDRYAFLDPALRRAIATRDGHPELGAGFESSVPGLHFLGAASMPSFGPLMRFVAGTAFTAKALTRSVRVGVEQAGRVVMPRDQEATA